MGASKSHSGSFIQTQRTCTINQSLLLQGGSPSPACPQLTLRAWRPRPARSSPRADGKVVRAARVTTGTVAVDLMGPDVALMKGEPGKSVPLQASAMAGCGLSPVTDGFGRGLGSGGARGRWRLSPSGGEAGCAGGKLGLKIIDSEGDDALLTSPRESMSWKELKKEKFPRLPKPKSPQCLPGRGRSLPAGRRQSWERGTQRPQVPRLAEQRRRRTGRGSWPSLFRTSTTQNPCPHLSPVQIIGAQIWGRDNHHTTCPRRVCSAANTNFFLTEPKVYEYSYLRPAMLLCSRCLARETNRRSYI